MALGEKTRQRRQLLGLTQHQLAQKVGVTQSAIYQLERRDSPTFRNIIALAEALQVAPEWLIGVSEAEPEAQSATLNLAPTTNDQPLHSQSHVVELPILVEIASSNGVGNTQIKEGKYPELPFAAAVLAKANVNQQDAAYVVVKGDSMAPTIPDGSIACVDRSDKTIADGKLYTLDHDGQLRIKKLIRLPGGGLRVMSFNPDYRAEEYSGPELDEEGIRIIGRVFWYSVTT